MQDAGAGPVGAGDLFIQFLPITVLSLAYAAMVFAVARKRRTNPWLWMIGALVPVLGFLIIVPLFMLLSFLSVFDRLDALEGRDAA